MRTESSSFEWPIKTSRLNSARVFLALRCHNSIYEYCAVVTQEQIGSSICFSTQSVAAFEWSLFGCGASEAIHIHPSMPQLIWPSGSSCWILMTCILSVLKVSDCVCLLYSFPDSYATSKVKKTASIINRNESIYAAECYFTLIEFLLWYNWLIYQFIFEDFCIHFPVGTQRWQ